MRNLKNYIFVLLAITVQTAALAQENWNEEGEIENAEVVIEKDMEIELPIQHRSFEKIPPVPVETSGIRQQYAFPSLDIAPPPSETNIKAMKLEKEETPENYPSLVKLGFGNFISPLAELYLYTKKNEKRLAGFEARHLSYRNGPVDRRNSGEAATSLRGLAGYFTKSYSLNGTAWYERRKYHFYGYEPIQPTEPDADSLKRVFNRYGTEVRFSNLLSRPDYEVTGGLKFQGQSDNLRVAENQLHLNASVQKAIKDNITGQLILSTDLIGYSVDTTRAARQRVGVEPSATFSGDRYAVSVGLRYVYQSDTALPSSQFYPILKGQYSFHTWLQAFAELSGNNRLNTWQSATAHVPFLDPQVDIHNTNNLLHIELGAKGHTSLLSYRLGFVRDVNSEQGFFLNSSDDRSRFLIVYDTGAFKTSHLFIDADLYPTNGLTVGLNFALYDYTTEGQKEAWHLEQYKLNMRVLYTAFSKIKATAGVMLAGGIKGYDTELEQSTDLKTAVDLYLHLDYLLSERAGAFLQFHNIANQEYQLLSNYPVRGLTVKAGLFYSF